MDNKLEIDLDDKKILSVEYFFNGKIEGKPVIGFCLNAVESGELVEVTRRGFYTDYDGDFFYNCLDSISNLYLKDWTSTPNSVSNISNCLIFIKKDNQFTVYINFPTLLEIIPRIDKKKGETIYKNELVDLKSISFPNIKFDKNCGVIYIFSSGWRRGFYFSFLPLSDETDDILENWDRCFSLYHAYLMFPEIYRMDSNMMNKLTDDGWFPFNRLLGKQFTDLFYAYSNDFNIDSIVDSIDQSFTEEKLNEMVISWFQKDEIKKSEKIIRAGIERFLNEDYISSINNLYPRIEGTLRYLYLTEKDSPNVQKLIDKLQAVAEGKVSSEGLLLPKAFCSHLKNFLFSSFDLKTGKIDLSRHSLAHGVADEDQFNKCAAIQGILILDQIHYYL